MSQFGHFLSRQWESLQTLRAGEEERLRRHNIVFYGLLILLGLGVVCYGLFQGAMQLVLISALTMVFCVFFLILLLTGQQMGGICTVLFFVLGMAAHFLLIYFGAALPHLLYFTLLLIPLSYLLMRQQGALIFNLILSVALATVLYSPIRDLMPAAYPEGVRLSAPLLFILSAILVSQCEWARYRAQLRLSEVSEELKEHVLTDPLTGLGNRNAFHQDFAHELNAGSLAYALIDADHFGYINAEYGNVAGDQVLKELAEIFKQGLRPMDRLYRWGSEEFMIVLPRISSIHFTNVLQRLRAKVESEEFKVEGNVPPVHLTVSIGGVMGTKGLTISECISHVNHCLFKAKENGRNRVIILDLSARGAQEKAVEGE